MNVPDGIPDRDGGPCPVCGSALVVRDGHFVPYFACENVHDSPVVIQSPRDVDYAMALIQSRITDPLAGDEFRGLDADAPDPARFIARFCERIALTYRSDQDQERDREQEREADRADEQPADDDDQMTFDTFAGEA